MSEEWYMCKMCYSLTRNSKQPNTNYCSVNKQHTWVKIGEVGRMNYRCSRCGTVIQGSPTSKPTGGDTCQNGTHFKTHDWHKLGLIGVLNYKCIKCGCHISSSESPLKGYSGCNNYNTNSPHVWKRV